MVESTFHLAELIPNSPSSLQAACKRGNTSPQPLPGWLASPLPHARGVQRGIGSEARWPPSQQRGRDAALVHPVPGQAKRRVRHIGPGQIMAHTGQRPAGAQVRPVALVDPAVIIVDFGIELGPAILGHELGAAAIVRQEQDQRVVMDAAASSRALIAQLCCRTPWPCICSWRAVTDGSQHPGNRRGVIAQISLIGRRSRIRAYVPDAGLVRIEPGQRRCPRRTTARAIVHCRHQRAIAGKVRSSRKNS